mmetsp:Transcript_41122/g.86033  ORF Transcript_41122/g.86033 Transcript_41122/m.86033 type:complete len:404 (+) Transcript_41122:21-1232(+)
MRHAKVPHAYSSASLERNQHTSQADDTPHSIKFGRGVLQFRPLDLLRCGIDLSIELPTDELQDPPPDHFLLRVGLAADLEPDRFAKAQVPGKPRVDEWSYEHWNVQHLADEDLEILASGAEGEARLAIPLEEDAFAMSSAIIQQHVLPLVSLNPEAWVLNDRQEVPSEQIHEAIVELHRLPGAAQDALFRRCSVGAMECMGLPIDVVEPQLAVLGSSDGAPRREVLLPAALDAEAVASFLGLRRYGLQNDAHGLPNVLHSVLERRLAAIQLEACRHVGPEARGEVEAHEEGHRLRCGPQGDLPLPFFPLVRRSPSRPGELSDLEVACLLTRWRNNSPHVERDDSRVGVDHASYPELQSVQGFEATLAARHTSVARIPLSPPEDVGAVVGRSKWHLRQGREGLC